MTRASLIDMGTAPGAARGVVDCNENGFDDALDITDLSSPDCNGNAIPDECEINENSIAPGGPFFCSTGCDVDCNHTGIPDACELTANDCNADGRPDECGVLLACAGVSSTEKQKFTASDAEDGAHFGGSVSLSGDTAIVGAYLDDCGDGERNCGAAYVYRFNGTSWIEQQKLTASDGEDYNYFGVSVSVSGATAVVGAYSAACAAGADCGAAYVYRYDGTNWMEAQKLTASDGTAGDRFGKSVSISGDTAIVGAWSVDLDTGAAYVYRNDGTKWIEEQKLTASDTTGEDRFGTSVFIDGETVVVGAHYKDCAAGENCGAAYVYRFDGTSWIEEQQLTASDGDADNEFGIPVSVSGDTAMVAARGNDCLDGSKCGAVYVYRFDGTNWVERQKLSASDAAAGAMFGSISLQGETVVVGAPFQDCAVEHCGTAYVFRYDGASWNEDQKLIASAWSEGDNETFGGGVAVSGATVLVNAPRSICQPNVTCGAVYVFDLFDGDCNCDGVANLCDNSEPDIDGDSVPDDCDICANGNDHVDFDGDGVPDDCDPCPFDHPDDTDGDGVCDSSDTCPGGDNTIDSDGDGVPDDCDVCPGGNDMIDTDGDGIPNDCDVCPNGSNTVDSDGDGVFDGCDICPGSDDGVDSDGDGVPDGCDACPGSDDSIDDDGDTVPNDCDICPGADDTVDSDSDSVPDCLDICAGGNDHADSDGDGTPDDCDLCPGEDDTMDGDGDGVPDACDACDNNVPEDCDFVSPILAAAPHNILKNRYISIDPRGEDALNTGGLPFDIRVSLASTLVNGVTTVGDSWWATAPVNGGGLSPATCISIVGPTQPASPPDWSGCPTLHLTGCPIIPTSIYEITAVVDGLQSGPPLVAATQAKPGVRWHGDTIGFFNGAKWTAPNGTVSADDFVAAIKTFQDPNAFNAAHLSVADVHPNLNGAQINLIVNIGDVFAIILGFQGAEYPGPQIELCEDPNW